MSNASDRRNGDRRQSAEQAEEERRQAERRKKQERRTDPRLDIELWMEEVVGEDVYMRCTGNVSEGGVFFDHAVPHPVGTVVALKFSLPGQKETIVATGEVVSTGEGEGMGVKFLEFTGDGKQRCTEFFRNR